MEKKWNKISPSESTNYFVLLMTKEIYELDEEEEYIGVKNSFVEIGVQHL
jgi:hypothetical protein